MDHGTALILSIELCKDFTAQICYSYYILSSQQIKLMLTGISCSLVFLVLLLMGGLVYCCTSSHRRFRGKSDTNGSAATSPLLNGKHEYTPCHTDDESV